MISAVLETGFVRLPGQWKAAIGVLSIFSYRLLMRLKCLGLR